MELPQVDPRVQQLVDKLAATETKLKAAQATIMEFNSRFCAEVDKVAAEYAEKTEALQTALNDANRQLRAYRLRDAATSNVLDAHFEMVLPELPAPRADGLKNAPG